MCKDLIVIPSRFLCICALKCIEQCNNVAKTVTRFYVYLFSFFTLLFCGVIRRRRNRIEAPINTSCQLSSFIEISIIYTKTICEEIQMAERIEYFSTLKSHNFFIDKDIVLLFSVFFKLDLCLSNDVSFLEDCTNFFFS